MNEWYSAAMIGLAISGASDWVWIPFRFLIHEQKTKKNIFLYSLIAFCS